MRGPRAPVAGQCRGWSFARLLLFWLLLAGLSPHPAKAQGFDQDIAGFEAADAANPPPRGVILFTGSSSIRGWTGLPSAFPGFDVLNRGFGGSDMVDVLYYFDRLVVPPHPSLAVVYEGDNDLAGGVSVANLLAQFSEFLDRMAASLPDTDVAFLAVKPSPSRLRWLPETLEFNAALRALAESRGASFIDVATPMLNSEGRPRPELFVSDRLHMNAAGYAIWNEITGDFLNEWKATRRLSFLVDFGGADQKTTTGASPGDPVRLWNNLTPDAALTPGGRLEDLVSLDGEPSSISLVIDDPFRAVAQGTAVDGWPAAATMDSLAGPASFTIAGLNPLRRYQLECFASDSGTSSNLQTEYTAAGATQASAMLDPAESPGGFAVLAPIAPAADGTISLTLRPGPDNSSDNGTVLLGILRIRQTGGESPAGITSQPESVTVQEFEDAAFHVSASGSPPLQVQWFRNGSVIPGATSLQLTISEATREFNGDTFTAVVSNGVSRIESVPATLTVVPDDSPPVLLSATSTDGLTFLLAFSEQVTAASAEHPSAYRINGTEGLVIHAAVEGSGLVVRLTLNEPVTGAFSVLATGVADRAGNAVPLPETVSGVVRRTFLFDFGGPGQLTASNPQEALAWNNVTPDVAATDTGRIGNLVSVDGTASSLSLSMVRRFNGVNTAGTTGSTVYPVTATQDTFFGNSEEFNGLADVFPQFRIEGLDPDSRYSLTFYASRTGVADNRETVYTVTGANSGMAILDAAGNVDQTATVRDIAPADGAISIALSPSPENSSPYHFTYLGVLVVDAHPGNPVGPPVLLTPVRDGSHVLLHWSGDGSLEISADLADWSPVLPAPESPYEVDLSGSEQRFFRLRSR